LYAEAYISRISQFTPPPAVRVSK